MYVDYHSHILPHMDDGAENVGMSLEMLNMLKNQGVDTVVSTSHFYAHRESVDNFIERRKRRFEELTSAEPAISDIILGAEVAVERDLSEKRNIEKLRIGETGYILLELPYDYFGDWALEEIVNIQIGTGLTPIIAHINRCRESCKKDTMRDLLELDGVIFQLNNEVFETMRDTAFALKLIKGGYPVVFGSDTHNMENRRPNFDLFEKKLSKKLKKDFDRFVNEYTSYLKR